MNSSEAFSPDFLFFLNEEQIHLSDIGDKLKVSLICQRQNYLNEHPGHPCIQYRNIDRDYADLLFITHYENDPLRVNVPVFKSVCYRYETKEQQLQLISQSVSLIQTIIVHKHYELQLFLFDTLDLPVSGYLNVHQFILEISLSFPLLRCLMKRGEFNVPYFKTLQTLVNPCFFYYHGFRLEKYCDEFCQCFLYIMKEHYRDTSYETSEEFFENVDYLLYLLTFPQIMGGVHRNSKNRLELFSQVVQYFAVNVSSLLGKKSFFTEPIYFLNAVLRITDFHDHQSQSNLDYLIKHHFYDETCFHKQEGFINEIGICLYNYESNNENEICSDEQTQTWFRRLVFHFMVNCQVDVFQRQISIEDNVVHVEHWVRLMNYFSFYEMMENCTWFKEEMEKKKKRGEFTEMDCCKIQALTSSCSDNSETFQLKQSKKEFNNWISRVEM